MVRDFGVAESPKDIAFYAGMLFSTFSVFQTMTVMYWGRLSDRIGRKPVIMIGLAGNLISSILFGTSKTFKAALFARSFNGLMAGNVAVIKSVVAEISDDTNRPRMMALLPLMWNVGSFAGTAVGGLFADPVTQYPSLFGNSKLFKEFPYLLPCLIGCFTTAAGLLIGLFRLEETLVRSPPRSKPLSASSSAATLDSENTSLVSSAPHRRTARELLTPTVISVMATNVIICVSISMAEQAYPIFAATDPIDGGLGFDTRSVGFSMAIASIAVLYIQLIAYPRLERKHGALKCYQNGQKIMIPFYLALPFLSLLAARIAEETAGAPFSFTNGVLWTLLIFLLLVRVTGTVLMFTSINLLTVNMAPTRADLGFMNGAQQLAMSATRIVGPVLSGIIWSWSIKHSFPFPFDAHLLWNICALLTIYALHISNRIPDSVNTFEAGKAVDNDRADPDDQV
ncbi:hypothetical protein LPJ66_000322 [Kickxella alabastrina]|uniref:Uncharacterized protein n=1 Tax=Kickxella alabastrina TaxID=61397 RepID=A0ACC1IWH5_9FUNG|nr:hypothetical protein LPJ66_000322 [Kickxella alabastrina]